MLAACGKSASEAKNEKPADETRAANAEESAATNDGDEDGWIALFDGKSLEGWTPNENPESYGLLNQIQKYTGLSYKDGKHLQIQKHPTRLARQGRRVVYAARHRQGQSHCRESQRQGRERIRVA
jgi:hypothetical protein